MPRKIQPTYTLARKYGVVALGDSLTCNAGFYLCPSHLMWLEVLVGKLRALGCGVRGRNWGQSGDTTTGMVNRQSVMWAYEVPAIGLVWGGVNDPGAAIAGATTQANIQAMVQALLNKGCTRIVVLNTQYLNYSTGGDTLATPYATYNTLRPFQAAAVNAFSVSNPGQVVLCDTYTYLRNLIVNGTETQGSFSWHVADSNQHLNARGQGYIAAAVLATIQGQSGWVAALQS